MNELTITLDLDTALLKQVQGLAKDDRRTLEDEAACLLEKGISICEIENNIKGENE